MSQDQPRSSDSSNPERPSESPETLADSVQSSVVREDISHSGRVRPRSTPSRRTPPDNDEILPQTLLRLLGEAFVAAQPPLKRQGIKVLRGTIHFLETAVERLEAEPMPKGKAPAPDPTVENVLPPPSKPNARRLAPTLSTDAVWKKFQILWRQLWRSWRSILRQLRDRLPAAINRNFSDQALTGAIVGILAIVLWATSALPDRSPPPVAKKPPVVTVTPSPSPTLAPTPTPTPIPPLVQAPETPKPVESSPAPIKPSPPSPPLKLTPEQTLIARIQDQVAAISNQYASGLVQSVQANFRGSRLIVHISGSWYGLSRSQQDKLAGELLRRTQTLDFSKLELVDGAGTLLARSPIVGTEMILLKRANALQQES